MIYDVFCYNGEKDILDIRLNILSDYVDRFIIVEFDKTFAGNEKPYYYGGGNDKIIHFKAGDHFDYPELVKLALESSLTGNKEKHWLREYIQKEMPREALLTAGIGANDIVFFGDCDEIWNPEILKEEINGVKRIRQFCYAHKLNMRIGEDWYGTSYGLYKDTESRTLNDWRATPLDKTEKEYGWHFTYQGDMERLKKKIESCDPLVCFGAPAEVLLERLAQGKDIMGRDFSCWIDEDNWPEYLKINKEKYKHLL